MKDVGAGEAKGRKMKARKGGERTQAQFNADRAKVLVGMGQYSRACQALSSRGVADSTDEVRATLQAKYPPAAGPIEHEE